LISALLDFLLRKTKQDMQLQSILLLYVQNSFIKTRFTVGLNYRGRMSVIKVTLTGLASILYNKTCKHDACGMASFFLSLL